MAREREELEALRAQAARDRRAAGMPPLRAEYFNEVCQCGHTRGAHGSLLGLFGCLESVCLCDGFQSRRPPVREENTYQDTERITDVVVPVRDDVTSYPSTGYIVRDTEEWFVTVQRMALPGVSSWPRRYAWCVRCPFGPYGARGRSLNKDGNWQFTTGMQDDELVASVGFDTPEQAYELWQRYQSEERGVQS